ncbi:peroxidase [Lithospermum erythrorhizon]|uniref:Peroxidase n=1 Tax=Lithospermum erythrorhizon TaxID=34254 RepID=A0AAV3Q020_LITER
MVHKIFPQLTILLFVIFCLVPLACYCQLDNNDLQEEFYDKSCPMLYDIIEWYIDAASKNDSRMAASLLRLHFHDCFVNGCEASVLLDETEDFKGEKNSLGNHNSLRGFELIDAIKEEVESYCPSTVSCADILALAAREAVLQSGGPYYPVAVGRRDGLTASEEDANAHLPSFFEPLDDITAKFTVHGLDLKDMVVLSGAHTIGFAQCDKVKGRLFSFKDSGKPDPDIDSSLRSRLLRTCPDVETSDSNVVALDYKTTYAFDNAYYHNLINKAGLLQSDQALIGNPDTAKLVNDYSNDPGLYESEFAASMVKMGNIGVLTGEAGQIRKKCNLVNY